jgi:purine-binding chemotaxis protein CheW
VLASAQSLSGDNGVANTTLSFQRSGGSLQLAVFRSDRVRCAVPLAFVERVLPMMGLSPLPGAPRVVMGLLCLQGQLLPVVDVRRRLLLPDCEYGVAAHLLVLETPRRRLAIATDEVQGVLEVDAFSVASASTVLAAGGPMTGAVSVSDGILLIHDIEAFLSQEEESQLAEATGETEPSQ